MSCPVMAQDDDVNAQIASITQVIKTNPTTAAATAEEMVKGKNKKNLDLAIGISRAFLDAKDINQAEIYFALAQKIKKNSAETMMLGGDIAVAKNDPGTACQFYDQAIYFEPKSVEAYIKYADIYKKVNPTLAIEKLNALDALIPNLPEVYKKMAEVYYTNGQFKETAEWYAKVDNAKMDEGDLTKYAFSLFMNHEFDKSLEIANAGAQKDPRDPAFNRLKMYNYADMKRYEDADQAAQALFTNSDKANFSYLDYTYYGYTLMGLKKYTEAIEQFNKAFQLDSTRTDVLKTMAEAYSDVDDNTNAIATYKKYIGTLKDADRTPDVLFQLGKICYTAGSDAKETAEARKSFLTEADGVFKEISEKAPDSYLGNLYRARTNSQLDPDTKEGLAKPYYEAAAKIIEGKNDNTKYASPLSECYRYLAFYYMQKNEKEESRKYWNKVLTLDPNNDVAKRALTILK